jgi:hypothetical protein
LQSGNGNLPSNCSTANKETSVLLPQLHPLCAPDCFAVGSVIRGSGIFVAAALKKSSPPQAPPPQQAADAKRH